MKNTNYMIVDVDFTFNNVDYVRGQLLKVTAEDNMRGVDLTDEYGNTIGETRFLKEIRDLTLQELRDIKLKNILGW